jgi:hypothetical protein
VALAACPDLIVAGLGPIVPHPQRPRQLPQLQIMDIM